MKWNSSLHFVINYIDYNVSIIFLVIMFVYILYCLYSIFRDFFARSVLLMFHAKNDKLWLLLVLKN